MQHVRQYFGMSDIIFCPDLYQQVFENLSGMFRACSYDGIFFFYVTRGILSEISFEVIFTSSDVQNLEHLYLGCINQFLFNKNGDISHLCQT